MRKVLSFALVLALVLSSFSMAFAANTTTTTAAPAAGLTDINGNANQDAIKVAHDLGIVTGNPDGTYLPAKAVTRAEFAALITRALDVPASALAGYTSTSFKDTTGYGWAVPYLAFAQSKGIMLGDGNGNAMPGRTISVNEAMTMALRAIGYTANSSLLVGAWPANYVSIAQNNDLYTDVAKTTTIDKANAAQIIYNLLTVQKVSVNSDGATTYLTKSGDVEANLLNTNLGCTENDNVVLGYNYDYDNSVINITDDIGAHGDAYLNSDGDLVAFTKDSTALTGKVNTDGDFEVGDTTYEFGANTVSNSGISIANTDVVSHTLNITSGAVDTFAAAKSDNGDTVTLNVDLSGKKIKDIYSMVAWKADDAAKADSDVQSSINDDHQLLAGNFVENDNNAIDMNSFQLDGVTSLDKIAENNVVAVYLDGSDNIRKVTVGTETVTGTIDEINDAHDTLTIGGKDYDVSSLINADTFNDSSVNSDGTFYLDANGAVFNFDGSAKADTYGVVKAATAQTSFDNYKVKLYTSDDSTKTMNLSESNPADIDWTTTGATTIGAVTQGALIGYSLNSDGQIDAIDNTVQSTNSVVFKSAKVLGTMSIASNAVVFTYDGAYATADPADYGVATLADIDAGTNVATATQPAMYILNSDGKVAAMFIGSNFANTQSDAQYAVINTRTTTTTDGDQVYKFTGFIDGKAFSYKTDDQTNGGTHSNYNTLAGVFGVYAVTTDASSQITKIDNMGAYSLGNTGLVANGAATALGSDNTVFTIGGNKYVAADDAVVYKYDPNETNKYSVSKLSAIDKNDTVALYDTKGDDADGIATVVIYQEN